MPPRARVPGGTRHGGAAARRSHRGARPRRGGRDLGREARCRDPGRTFRRDSFSASAGAAIVVPRRAPALLPLRRSLRPRGRASPLDRFLPGARRPAGVSGHREPDGHPEAGRREGNPRRRHDGRRHLGRDRPLGRFRAGPGRHADGLVLHEGGARTGGDRPRRARGRRALRRGERPGRRPLATASPSSRRSRR